METWPHHIDRFYRQYDKAFAKEPLFREDLIDRIHKRVQASLHSSTTTSIKDVESGELAEFGVSNKSISDKDIALERELIR